MNKIFTDFAGFCLYFLDNFAILCKKTTVYCMINDAMQETRHTGEMQMIKQIKKWLCVGLAVLLTGCASEAAAGQAAPVAADATLAVHYIDVGQADCALLESGGHYMLIDAGNNADAETILSYLRGQGVERLDIVVGTHPHEDHIGSLDTVIETFDVGQVYLPKVSHTSKTYADVLDAVAAKGLKIKAPTAGERTQFADLPLTFYGPVKTYDDLNNNSIVLKVQAGETTFLFTGDAETQAENDLLAAGYDLRADVLKVGHHGSATSSSQAFLDAVSPQIAVISVGQDNSYGHPDAAVLQRLQAKGAAVYQTKESGTILCRTDGETITVQTGAETALTVQHSAQQTQTQPAQAQTPAEGGSTPAVVQYIGNRSSKKFHLPTCASLPQERNRVTLESREAAIAAGYSPCGSCKP